MALPNQTIALSVQKLEEQEGLSATHSRNITCCIYCNSQSIAVFKLSDPHTPVICPTMAPKDVLQIIFYKDNQKEVFGCISFLAQQFFAARERIFSQWITLFDEPEDDRFDGKIGEDDQEFPRVLFQFDAQKEYQQTEYRITFENYLKTKEEENYFPLISALSSIECSRLEQLPQKSNYLPASVSQDIEDLNAQLTAMDSPDRSHNVTISHMQMELHPAKHSFSLERKSSRPSVNQSEDSLDICMPFNLKKSEHGKSAEALASFESFKPNNVLAERRLEDNPDTFRNIGNVRPEPKDDIIHIEDHSIGIENGKENVGKEGKEYNFPLKVENVYMSNNKVEELQSLVEKLQKENALRRHNEENYAQKFLNLKAELENLRVNNYQLMREKDDLTVLLHQTYEKSKEYFNISNLSFTEKISQEEKEREALINENFKANQEIVELRTQIQFDETILHNLQREVYALKQKEETYLSLDLENKLSLAEKKILAYEEKVKALMEAYSLSLTTCDSPLFEDCVTRIQNEFLAKITEIDELKSNNKDLVVKLSVSENKLLADSLVDQISDLKKHLSLMEKERDTLRTELFKSNENYMTLTNKYMELSDALTAIQKSRHPTAQRSLSQSSLKQQSLSARKSSTASKTNSSDEVIDEIETKVSEFIAINKISPSTLTKVEKGVYLYSGRKVFLKVLKGQLVIKTAEGFKPLQDFLKAKNVAKTPTKTSKPLNKTSDQRNKSFELKGNLSRIIEHYAIQAADQSQRELSSDMNSTSRSFVKDSGRTVVRQCYYSNPNVLDVSNSDAKNKLKKSGNVKLKEILSSKSVERKTPYGLYQSNRDKSKRELTPS